MFSSISSRNENESYGRKKKEQYKPLKLQVNFQNHDWMQALDFPIYHTVNLKKYLAKQLFFLSIA